MKTYKIPENRMEELNKKITRVRNKCKQLGCDFHFEEIGEEFQKVEIEPGQEAIVRFVVVEAEGLAKINGWEFAGTIEHTEYGNIIRGTLDIEVPERYRTASCVCEHCNKIRSRNDTYLVHNVDTGEFKQVGRNCLCDFTGGLSTDIASRYEYIFKELDTAAHDGFGGCGNYIHYRDRDTFLRYAVELVKKFGYTPSNFTGATRDKALDYYSFFLEHARNKFVSYVEDEAAAIHFEPDSEENFKKVEAIKKYFTELDDHSDYISNLKIICKMEYLSSRHLGYAASMVPTYNKAMEREEAARIREKKQKEESANSEYQGKEGQRIEINISSMECVCSSDTMYGISFLYKMVDTQGNIYMWSTSNFIDDIETVNKVVGTVKNHQEYRGVKQTWMTRCKVSKKSA